MFCTRVIVVMLIIIVTHKTNAMDNLTFNTTNSDADEYEGAEETQHTFCKIATEELQATANATITRELKGVATSKELKRVMNSILREIQKLSDALVRFHTESNNLHTHAPNQTNRNKRKNRKNLLDLFAISNKNFKNNISDRYFYYWSITDAEQYLIEGLGLKSPVFIFEGAKYYLRLTIKDKTASFQLVSKDNHDILALNYKILILSKESNVKDLQLDETNNYTLPLHQLRQHKQSDTVYIKLVIN